MYQSLGISPEFYHFNAIPVRGIDGVLSWIGAAIFSDFLTLDVLLLVLKLGVAVTLIYGAIPLNTSGVRLFSTGRERAIGKVQSNNVRSVTKDAKGN